MVSITFSSSTELSDSPAREGEQKGGAAPDTAGPAVSIRGNPQMKDTRSTESHPCCSSLGLAPCDTARAEDASGRAHTLFRAALHAACPAPFSISTWTG